MRRYLIAGLLVWVPLGITIWVLHALVSALDQTLLLVPESWRPEALFGFGIPGLGVLLSFVILMLTGILATNVFGRWGLRQAYRLLHKIPIVKSIYSSVKQVSDTLFSSNGNAFREAVLVQYPRAGSWTIAFVTGRPSGEVAARLGSDHVAVYVPTTPNPTSGFFLVMPRAEVHPSR